MPLIKSRQVFLAIFLYIFFCICFALYLQYFQSIKPCPLCMLQRVVFIVMGLFAALAVYHNPRTDTWTVYGIIGSVISLLGISLAGRHFWLESLPPEQAPACGPSLDILLQYLPLFDALKVAIAGSGDCAKVAWSFLGLSIAGWSLLSFVLIFLACVYVILRPIGRF